MWNKVRAHSYLVTEATHARTLWLLHDSKPAMKLESASSQDHPSRVNVDKGGQHVRVSSTILDTRIRLKVLARSLFRLWISRCGGT